jgi:endonuclease III
VTRAEKARRIARILDRLHPDSHVPLDHVDPFTLLVAVILSAQCTDERVNQVTPALFARASTPEAMAKLSPAEIERMIRSCGLGPAKAKAIHRLSEILRDQYDGQVPADIDALEELPGVGHKTASVVMVQAFGVPAFPVDTHIHRLAGRWGLSRARNVAEVERDLKAGLGEGAPPDHPVRTHTLPRARPRPARVSDLLLGGVAGADRAGDGSRASAREEALSVTRSDSLADPSRTPPSGVRPDRRSSSRT